MSEIRELNEVSEIRELNEMSEIRELSEISEIYDSNRRIGELICFQQKLQSQKDQAETCSRRDLRKSQDVGES